MVLTSAPSSLPTKSQFLRPTTWRRRFSSEMLLCRGRSARRRGSAGARPVGCGRSRSPSAIGDSSSTRSASASHQAKKRVDDRACDCSWRAMALASSAARRPSSARSGKGSRMCPSAMRRALRVRRQRLEEVASAVRPAADLDDRARLVEVVVDDVRVGDEIALVAGQELSTASAVVARASTRRARACSGATSTQKCAAPAPLLGASTSTPVASVHRYGCRERVLVHRVDQRPRELGQLLVPAADRRAWPARAPRARRCPSSRCSGRWSCQRAHDRVGQHARAGEAARDRQLRRFRPTRTSAGLAAVAVLAHELRLRTAPPPPSRPAAARAPRASRRRCARRRRAPRARPRAAGSRSARAADVGGQRLRARDCAACAAPPGAAR